MSKDIDVNAGKMRLNLINQNKIKVIPKRYAARGFFLIRYTKRPATDKITAEYSSGPDKMPPPS
jgi:hypothetical protein